MFTCKAEDKANTESICAESGLSNPITRHVGHWNWVLSHKIYHACHLYLHENVVFFVVVVDVGTNDAKQKSHTVSLAYDFSPFNLYFS